MLFFKENIHAYNKSFERVPSPNFNESSIDDREF
jgi:hypothetical protein